MNNLINVVIAMAFVTYIPRMVPMTMLDKVPLPPDMKKFLQFIPHAVLASLIFPGILTSVEPLPSAIAGAAAAFILAFLRVNLVLVVLGSIVVVFITGIYPA